jgi:cell division protein FtsB
MDGAPWSGAMPLDRKNTLSSNTPGSGRLSKFLLSPHFTGLVLPAVILAVGAVYHLVTIRQHRETEQELRKEIQTLQSDKKSLESRLEGLEGGVEKLKRASGE